MEPQRKAHDDLGLKALVVAVACYVENAMALGGEMLKSSGLMLCTERTECSSEQK